MGDHYPQGWEKIKHESPDYSICVNIKCKNYKKVIK